MPKTYNDLYLAARRRLRDAGIEAASLEARELICYASGKDRDSFLRDARLYTSDEVEGRLEELLQRRTAGEPTAYLIGEWEFYGLPLDITRDVLIPRSDTETVAQRAIEIARKRGACRVLDLCTGSGCIGLAVAANAPEAKVVLCDISEPALHVARANARRNGLSRRVMALKADARQDPPAMLGRFDLIVSNPPYIRSGDLAGLDVSVRDYEPALALDGGEDGLDFYRAIIENWQRALEIGGAMLFEVGYDQADDVERLFARAGFHDIDTHRDSQEIWRAVEGWL
ncbi:MAG: peptide chain release factor N(5)-glutamine methyltransferase [Oscillospiraceae bacterium]|nr:peptide chain release factor N(5)-glutamine methyltransferase [Oscillospiraceae bacterium]